MKVAIIINSIVLGGLERVSLNLAYWMSHQNGCHATIVALNRTNKNKYDVDGFDYYQIEGINKVFGLRQYIRKKNPDLVLTMGVPLCIYTVPALIGTKVRHVVSERNDPAHFAGKTTTKILSRFFMRFADGYVFQTKQAQHYYNKNIIRKSVIIHNPLLNIPIAENNEKIEIQKEIVTMGRLVKQKNQEMLIHAFSLFNKEFPDYSLTIYGEGEEREKLQSVIESNQLQSKISLPGSTEDVLNKIKSATLFVLSSDFEGMPNALMEAMAVGLPCVSTDCPCGGPSELIQNGKNGILVPVGDATTMAEAMKKIISERDYAKSLGKEATHINETHSMDKICKQWQEFFIKILS